MRHIFIAIMGLMVIMTLAFDASAQKPRRHSLLVGTDGGIWKAKGIKRNITAGNSNTMMRSKAKDGTSNTVFSSRSQLAGSDFNYDNPDAVGWRTESVGKNETISVGGKRSSSLVASTYGRGVTGGNRLGLTVDPHDRDVIYLHNKRGAFQRR